MVAERISTSFDGLARENEALRTRLAEAENKLAEAQDVIRAIQAGDVDAVVVSSPQGDQVFTLKGAEYAYRALIEAMNEGAATLASDGTVLYCNQHLADLLGIPLEQIIGGPVAKHVAVEARHTFEVLFAHAMTDDAAKGEIELQAESGDPIPVYVSLREMKSVEPSALCMVVTDLSEHKKRDELIAAGRLATSILESAAEAIAVCDENGRIISVNQALEDLCGFNPMLQPFESALPLELNGELAAPGKQFSVSDALAGVVERGQEVSFRRNDGQTLSLLLSPGRITGPSGVAGCVFTLTDITGRKRAEEQLFRLNRTLKALNASNEALLHASDEKTLLEQVCRIITEDCGHAMVWIGFAENDEAKSVVPVAHAGFDDGYLENLRVTWSDTERGCGPSGTAIRTGQPCMCRNMRTDPLFEPWREEALKRGYASSLVVPLMADGKAFGTITIYSREPDPFSHDEVALLAELASDLSYGIGALRLRAAHAQAEEVLRKQSELMRLSFDAIIVWRLDGAIENWNRGAEQLYGYSESEALGHVTHNLLKTIFPMPWPEIEARLRKAGQWEGELRHTTKEGREMIVSARKQLIVGTDDVARVLETNRDISERKRSEEALSRSEKLASVGRMASTIAHEINNPLETIGHAVYLALTDPATSPATKSYLELATQELDRVTHITKQTLAFNREDKSPTLIDLRTSVDSIVKLYAPRLKAREIAIEKRYAEVDKIKAGGGEIQQVISNLLANSMDATPNHGKIELRVSRSIGRNRSRLVRFTIADTGSGIPPEQLKKIFEPFFTTKEIVGTGLGLWVTKQIVEKHGARIRVRSKPGRGTVFSIAFPAAERTSHAH